MTRALVATLALSFLGGCRALHEAAIKQRLVQARFYGREVKRPLAEVDAYLGERRQDLTVRTWCDLCVQSAQTLADGARRYCLASRGETACVVARAASDTSTRFEAEDKPSSTQVARALWWAFDPDGAANADLADEHELSRLAWEEEESFTPRWTFLAGAKAGTVVSYDPPSFTFGGQAGVRYWSSLFVLPGAALEIENLLQGGRSFITSSLQGRIELALWSERNTRFLNLPRLTFLMSGGPLLGFGRAPALGGRAVFGIHLDHLAEFVTPFFFELGFQALEVDGQSATGLRVALGIGL
jgi:hypothetical protein